MFKRVLLALTFAAVLCAGGLGFSNQAAAWHDCYEDYGYRTSYYPSYYDYSYRTSYYPSYYDYSPRVVLYRNYGYPVYYRHYDHDGGHHHDDHHHHDRSHVSFSFGY